MYQGLEKWLRKRLEKRKKGIKLTDRRREKELTERKERTMKRDRLSVARILQKRLSNPNFTEETKKVSKKRRMDLER